MRQKEKNEWARVESVERNQIIFSSVAFFITYLLTTRSKGRIDSLKWLW